MASARVTGAVALVGLSAAWNGGNMGPVASEIANDVGVSLAVVGLLSGTFFFGSVVAGLLVAAQVGERAGIVRGLRFACALIVFGNLLIAVVPAFAALAVGRILPGLAFALVNALGAVWARDEGGVRLVGVFGASIQGGLALALVVGSLLSDSGVDWRIGFVISAALGAAAFVAIPRGGATPVPGKRAGFLRAALHSVRVYRLALLFVSIYGVPMILGAWLVEYLAREGDVAKALAGGVAFLLFGLSAVVRVLGARLQQRDLPHAVLCGALGLAAIGMAALALDPVAAIAFGAVVLVAVGFGIPYATAMTEAQDLYPQAPFEPVALMTLVALSPPIAAIPVIGHALENGAGDLAFGILAFFLALATVANLRPTGIPLVAPRADASP